MDGAALGKDVWNIISKEIDDEATKVQLAKTCRLLNTLIEPYKWYFEIRTIKQKTGRGKIVNAREITLDPVLNVKSPLIRLSRIILKRSSFRGDNEAGYIFLIFDLSGNKLFNEFMAKLDVPVTSLNTNIEWKHKREHLPILKGKWLRIKQHVDVDYDYNYDWRKTYDLKELPDYGYTVDKYYRLKFKILGYCDKLKKLHLDVDVL